MKRLFILLTVLAMVLCLFGCGAKEEPTLEQAVPETTAELIVRPPFLPPPSR